MQGSNSERPHPSQLGRYELLAAIATGGMATVYLARATGAGGFSREVAVKLLDPRAADEQLETGEQLLLAEARLAAQVRHPAVVPVLDAGESPHGAFLVMEFVEGDSLANLLHAARRQGGTLPRDIALKVLCDALDGLHAAHEARDERGKPLGIVHRDFSPQNILVGIDGGSRLTDFGIARALDRAEYTRTGIVRGKIGYMSPEQAEGLSLDRSADVWAAGVVAWEAFAGQRLFNGEPVPTLLRIINSTPPALSSVLPDAPPALSDVIASALTKDVNLRCHTADELRRRLLAACHGWAEPAAAAEVADFVSSVAAPKLRALRERAAAPRAAAPPAESPNAARPRRAAWWWAAAAALIAGSAATLKLSSGGAGAPAIAPAASSGVRANAQPRAETLTAPAPALSTSATEPSPGVRAESKPKPRLKSTGKAASKNEQATDLAPNPY